MKRNLIHFLLIAVMAVCSMSAFAQTITVKGQLVDSETGEPLVGAAVMVESTTQGSVTDIDGYFKQAVASNATLVFKYVGYKDLKQKIIRKGASVDLGIIQMHPDAVMLSDVVITSSVAIARKTPVAVSTVTPVFIEERLGTQEFPEILKTTPGIYATKKGGAFGDSELRMRGFKSENVAVLVNGVPMNDMEWGGLYWSNWTGLSDVTRSTQTQRGLGASKVSAPSVGGSVNIVTKGADAEKGGTVSYAMGNDGYNKMLFSLSTGMSKSGWALTLLGAKTWGDGYIQSTDFEAYNWFVNLTKRFNENHQLSLTAFGAPQWHNQRNNNNGLSIKEWQNVKQYVDNLDDVYKYNPSFGYRKNGVAYNQNQNKYNKPQISLNHQWQIDHKSSLSTVAYVSIGRGYGSSGQANTEIGAARADWYAASKGTLSSKFRNADGTFAYDQMEELNEQSANGSLYAMSISKNYHNWYGLVSTYTTKFGEYVDFYGGVDFRYYKGTHTNEISDLFGGKFFVDYDSRRNVKVANNAAAADPNFIHQKLTIGDVIYRDYDGYTVSEGAFAQAEYNKDKLSAFLSGSLSNTSYWRYDRLYYDEAHAKSDKVNFMGFTAKGGANYNITDHHNIFANIGYISRAPFFSYGAFLQAQTSNATNPDAVNEKIFSVELGYGYRSKWLTANLNAYFTRWMDKTMTSGGDITNANREVIDRYSINMQGVDARHMGVELDLVANPTRWLDINGMFSLGDWQWDSNATGYYYNSLGQPLKNIKSGEIASGIQASDHAKSVVNLKGVKVGGSAQLTTALGAQVHFSGFRGGLTYTWYARNYSDYDLDGSMLSPDGNVTVTQPWKIPSGGQFDLNASYTFPLGKCKATLYGNVENVFNQRYIVDATDGGTGKWENAYEVFYAFGRTYSLRLKVAF
ncbi:TonB-dependent receptor [uncultured Bacteroides sp.]|uniref:TonB-dependent receptor n=1 Tax=uncultured Bacteroides sp. TaxID=162156 RepID=UPI002624117A|nr:TonB-dependent receptor [uncultured Bacteroides sp.]